jgi:DNA polymerase-3 subunit epsilon
MTYHQKSQGKSLRVVVEVLIRALAWKVILIHIARIEKQSLRQVCLELYGVSPLLMILDTCVMAKRELDRSDIAYDPQELRLSALRHKHNLPNYFSHNALNDAITTAELLLVQQKTGATKLKNLL